MKALCHNVARSCVNALFFNYKWLKYIFYLELVLYCVVCVCIEPISEDSVAPVHAERPRSDVDLDQLPDQPPVDDAPHKG